MSNQFKNILLSTDHVFVCGTTGTGKTVFARELYEQAPHLGIFINIQDEKMKGKKCAAFDWRDPIDRGVRRININPHLSDQDYKKIVNDTILELMEMGRAIKERPKSPWCWLVIDEAHVFLPNRQDDTSQILQVLRRGKRRGIKVILVSQYPADVSKAARTQCEQHVIFRINQYAQGYLKDHNIPVAQIQAHTEKDYHFCVWDGFNASPHPPLKIGGALC